MIDAFFGGLGLVFAWPALGYLLLGVLFGLWLGAVPGLGGITGVVIILPFTFGMDTVPALALILGVFAVTATSDTIASVMLGIPGTAASQATVMDGYPMAQKGQAARAFGAAFTASAIGGVLGGLAMAASLPLIRPLILSFGTPEFFLLGALGLTMVATVSGAAISKGLAAAAAGLLLSQIGFPVASEEPRYWFEIMYLIGGLPLIPVVLGLFAIPEMLDLAVRNSSISRVDRDEKETLTAGIRDALRNWWLVVRCSWIGIYIGMLPGLGGMIADWVAYGHAAQSSKLKAGEPEFGKGNVRGVIAPEAANNAVMGGALIPTIGLGIPGSASMAILLGAFTILGLAPGRAMLSTHLDITFALVWMLIVANIFGAGLLMVTSRQMAKLSFVSGHLIVPGVLLFVFMGAWLDTPALPSWITVLAFGTLGYLMKRGGWPRPALVLGFVLGPVMESALVLSWQSFSVADVMTRPLALILLALVVVALVLAVRSTLKMQRVAAARPSAQVLRGNWASLLLGLGFTVTFVLAIWPALDWPPSARRFPLVIAPVGALCAFVALMLDLRSRRGARPVLGIDPETLRSVGFLVSLAAMIAVAALVGQPVALVGFVGLYLAVAARRGALMTLGYTLAAAVVLYLIYDRTLHVRWLSPVFSF